MIIYIDPLEQLLDVVERRHQCQVDAQADAILLYRRIFKVLMAHGLNSSALSTGLGRKNMSSPL